MDQRSLRAQTARETLKILERGRYTSPGGRDVLIAPELTSARARSVLYAPADFDDVFQRRDQILKEHGSRAPATFEVVNETTLHAARRLVDSGAGVLALNFASARNPGGGFLNGSQAQEESLARASGLYACIASHRKMYDINKQHASCLYTDHMIYSPDVPVFRDDEDALLDRPYPASFITAPAANAGAIRAKEPKNATQIEPVMLARMEKVFSVAVIHGHDTLILGAWGCGVFGNDAAAVAAWFARHLKEEGLFRTAFRKVVFAVLDRTPDGSTIRLFEQH